MNKSTGILAAAFLSVAVLSACGDDDGQDTPSSNNSDRDSIEDPATFDEPESAEDQEGFETETSDEQLMDNDDERMEGGSVESDEQSDE
ncbi:hypothetical protein [Alkalicoccobacillus gibsonii]|jgi:hypothetical protein|uniref:hypothetical protein n=1 Tax=Alkalicoccobacillus gibsonii TaxID=79881 RepID=UPI001933270B|nr:hypothetical protein [Alkalicoccobacillus gibsonii]MBM0065880.1 hypothetical protein [Alkalicoccobacillus gibsonii]